MVQTFSSNVPLINQQAPRTPLEIAADRLGIKASQQGLQAGQQKLDANALNAQQQSQIQAILKDPAAWDQTTGMPTPDAVARVKQVHAPTGMELEKHAAGVQDTRSQSKYRDAQTADELAQAGTRETVANTGKMNAETAAGQLVARQKFNAATLREKGFKLDADGNPVPVDRSELGPKEIADLEDKEAATAIRASQKELNEARASLARMQADPKSPQYAQAAQRLETARMNANAAQARLGIAQENTDIRKATFEATGGISPERQKMQANAQSGLEAIKQLRLELTKPGMLLAMATPGSVGARTAMRARNEMVDVLTRLRTGAALNKEEEAFYQGQAPGLMDEIGAAISSNDKDAIEYSLKLFENQFKMLAGPNAVTLPNRSTAVPSGGNVIRYDKRGNRIP